MRDPEKFVEGDIFLHEPTRRIVRAEFYDPKTEHVTMSDGAVIPARDLIDIEEPGYMRAVVSEIAMLRRALRDATASSVCINGQQFMCSNELRACVEANLQETSRLNANVKSLQHRINGYARDIDKNNGKCAVQLERIGRLRGTLDGAIFAIKDSNTAGALAVLEAGTKI